MVSNDLSKNISVPGKLFSNVVIVYNKLISSKGDYFILLFTFFEDDNFIDHLFCTLTITSHHLDEPNSISLKALRTNLRNSVGNSSCE